MTNNTAKWVHLGNVGVDAGMLAIGDPAYLFGENTAGNAAFKTWADFIKAQRDSEGADWQLRHQIDYAMGHEGLGVVAGTAHGDGVYKVYGLKTDDTDRTLAMIVVTGDDPALDFLPDSD